MNALRLQLNALFSHPQYESATNVDNHQLLIDVITHLDTFAHTHRTSVLRALSDYYDTLPR